MKKQNVIGIVVIIILGAVAALLIYQNRKSTFKEELKDFAVKDTAAITRIFLADKSGNTSDLVRKSGGQWEVNGKFIVRKEPIKTLLTTIARVEVKAPLAKAAHDNMLRKMAASAIKVEIYKGEELVKTYYVGSHDQNTTGTIMMIENSSTPFITCIPGFEGYLTPRYITKELLWRNKIIFNTPINQIASFKLTYNKVPSASFEIKVGNNFSTQLFAPSNPASPVSADSSSLKEYLLQIPALNFQDFVVELKQKSIDSILATPVFHEIVVTDKKGARHSLKTFAMKPAEDQVDKDGKQAPYNLETMYAQIDGKDLVYIQFYAFDGILKPIQYFMVRDKELVKN